MAKPGETGIKRIISAAGYSIKGLSSCWRSEAAFRQEVLGSVVLVPLAFYLGDNGMEVALMILTCMLVLIVELLNSSVEAAIDRIGPEYHQLSGQAKDIGSAAVMVSIGTLLVTWGLVLFY
jgi:diacylglycerol kinase (ATP)